MGREAVAGEDIAAIEVLGGVSVQVSADHGSGPMTLRMALMRSPSASSMPSTLMAPWMSKKRPSRPAAAKPARGPRPSSVVGAALDDAAGQGARVGRVLDLGGPILVA